MLQPVPCMPSRILLLMLTNALNISKVRRHLRPTAQNLVAWVHAKPTLRISSIRMYHLKYPCVNRAYQILYFNHLNHRSCNSMDEDCKVQTHHHSLRDDDFAVSRQSFWIIFAKLIQIQNWAQNIWTAHHRNNDEVGTHCAKVQMKMSLIVIIYQILLE